MSGCTCDIGPNSPDCEYCQSCNRTRDRKRVLFESVYTVRGLLLDAYERGMRRGLAVVREHEDLTYEAGQDVDWDAVEAQVRRELSELRV